MAGFFDVSALRRFRHRSRREVGRKRPRNRAVIIQAELLEPRVVLAADVFSALASGSLTDGWHVIVLNANQDDLHLRSTQVVVGNVPAGGPAVLDVIQFDTDPNFTTAQERFHIPVQFRDVLITNGVRQALRPFNSASVFDGFGNGGASLDLRTAAQSGIVPPNTQSSLNAVVPGTLSGEVEIDDARGTDRFFYTTQRLQDGGTTADVLVFSVNPNGPWAPNYSITHSIFDKVGAIVDKTIAITGDFDYSGGTVALDFTTGENFALFAGAGATRTITADYASPIIPNGPSLVRLAPGLDLNTGLLVDLPAEDSTIEIASPVLSAGVDSVVVLSATNVIVDAPITSKVGFYSTGTTGTAGGTNAAFGIAGNWYGGGGGDTEIEQVILTATVTAPEIGINIVDDADTFARSRGLLHVASSAALAGTTRVAVESTNADITFEGDVSAAEQSYLFRTRSDATPFRFVTTGATGESVGEISATSVDIFLVNTVGFDPADSVEHVIDLDTDVASLRIAATQSSGQLAGTHPFPYAVTVREKNALSLDASLASGGPVAISAGGALAVNATVQSARDVSLTSAAAITGNAQLTTTAGAIAVTGSSVSLTGLLQVLATPVDETFTDIQVVATDGSILLNGGALAVNRVRLDQSGSGAVSSGSLVGAEYLDVFSDGDVSLQTQARYVQVEAGGAVTLTEADDAEFEVTAAGLATLSALGIDPADGSSRAALKAEVRGATSLVVSAPSGSVDVIALTAAATSIGNSAGLLSGSAASMQAAGDVKIRSTQGDVFVLDAPIAGDGLLQARVASAAGTAGNLPGTYAQNTPGIRPSTLTATGNGSLNAITNFNTIFPGQTSSPLSLRVRDLVLLRGQTTAAENGLYQITQLGSSSTPWRVTRVSQADTTAEFRTNTRIAITDGSFAGQSFRVGTYTNTLNTTPLRVTQGSARSASEVTVRLATDVNPLAGTFNAGARTITANANGLLSLQDVTPAVAVNDLILVTHGVAAADGASSVANGVYRVTSVGSATTPWTLTRVTGVEEATVVVSEGYYRTAVTGKTFSVAYDGLGTAPVAISPVAVSSQIGSYDPRDTTTFVVSTAGGSNDAAGSLGKMLRLLQENTAKDFSQDDVQQTVRFGNVLGSVTGETGTIVLRQELPLIKKAFEIDTATRYPLSAAATLPIVVDGSRITSTRESTFVTRSTDVNGFEFTSGAGTSLSPTPEEATRSRISGVRIAGFEAGGAVRVDGASNLLIENLSIGLDAAGASQGVKYGIQVTGASGAAGPVTLLNNSIYSASVFDSAGGATPLIGAGVFIDGAAQGVQVVGGTIGGAQGSNTSGIVIESTNNSTTRANSIGVNPLSAVVLNTTSNRVTLTIPQAAWSAIGQDLFLGQSVSGSGIAAGSEIIHINPATREVTLSNRMTSSVVGSTVTFGAPGRTTVSDNFYGVEMRAGNIRMTNTTVSDNVLDGVVVGKAPPTPATLPPALWAKIGAGIAVNTSGNPDPTVRSAASNAIFSNGRYGIRFASGINSMSASFVPSDPTSTVPTVISVQGNYIGTNTSGSAGLENGRSDYYWDRTNSSTNAPEGVSAVYNTNGIRTRPPTSFFTLISSGNPSGSNPAEDSANGNVSTGLAPPTAVSSGGTTAPTAPTTGGVVRLPPRL